MEILGQTSIQAILFIVIYSITGVVPLIAALYLLLRRGNAFAPDTTPPLRLRRWAASFFAVAALRQLWWLLFCVFSNDIRSVDDTLHSAGYVTFVVLDYVTILSTIAGTLLAMLQDRRRHQYYPHDVPHAINRTRAVRPVAVARGDAAAVGQHPHPRPLFQGEGSIHSGSRTD